EVARLPYSKGRHSKAAWIYLNSNLCLYTDARFFRDQHKQVDQPDLCRAVWQLAQVALHHLAVQKLAVGSLETIAQVLFYPHQTPGRHNQEYSFRQASLSSPNSK